MKRIFFLLSISVLSFNAMAQSDIKTETLKVEGNCGMCKKRIEAAAFVKGVKRAEWNKETRELKVTYRTSKTNTDAIAQSIAKVGHNTEKLQAAKADYKKLPQCCHYKTHVCND